MASFLKCNCEHCGGRIEYPTEAVGSNAACPHCQHETPLRLEAADEAEGVVVGGGRAKLVIGTVVACLVAVGALVAAGLWAKQQRTAKLGPTTPGKSTGPASPAAAPVVGGKVVLDPPKAVVPFIGKFQNGLTGAQLRPGRDVLAGPCVECHRQYDPATYEAGEWSRILGGMRGKAKLRPKESQDLDTFVRSLRE